MTGSKPRRRPKRIRSRTAARYPALANFDHRSRTARELRQEMAALERDVAGGDPSMQQRMLVERAVAVNAFCRGCEERMAQGDDIEVALWLTATNTLASACSATPSPLRRDWTLIWRASRS